MSDLCAEPRLAEPRRMLDVAGRGEKLDWSPGGSIVSVFNQNPQVEFFPPSDS